MTTEPSQAHLDSNTAACGRVGLATSFSSLVLLLGLFGTIPGASLAEPSRLPVDLLPSDWALKSWATLEELRVTPFDLESGRVFPSQTISRVELSRLMVRLGVRCKGLRSLIRFPDTPAASGWDAPDQPPRRIDAAFLELAVQTGTISLKGRLLKPDAPASRFDVIHLLARIFMAGGLAPPEVGRAYEADPGFLGKPNQGPSSGRFPDMPRDSPSFLPLAWACSLGMFQGYDPVFHGQASISRRQFIYLLAQALTQVPVLHEERDQDRLTAVVIPGPDYRDFYDEVRRMRLPDSQGPTQ